MDRPNCNPIAPDCTRSAEILEHLLNIELKRLETAVRIENERNIVFPETTVIIRDIQKLMGALGLKAKQTDDDFSLPFD